MTQKGAFFKHCHLLFLTYLLAVVVKNPKRKMAKSGPAKSPMAVLPSCKTPSKLAVMTAKPTVTRPMNAAMDRLKKTCLPSVMVTDQGIGRTKSSQTTAANELSPDDRVL